MGKGNRCLPERISSPKALAPFPTKSSLCFIVSGFWCHRDLSSSFPFPVGLIHKSQANLMWPLHLKLPLLTGRVPKSEQNRCVDVSVRMWRFLTSASRTCDSTVRKQKWKWEPFLRGFWQHTISKITYWKCAWCLSGLVGSGTTEGMMQGKRDAGHAAGMLGLRSLRCNFWELSLTCVEECGYGSVWVHAGSVLEYF